MWSSRISSEVGIPRWCSARSRRRRDRRTSCTAPDRWPQPFLQNPGDLDRHRRAATSDDDTAEPAGPCGCSEQRRRGADVGADPVGLSNPNASAMRMMQSPIAFGFIRNSRYSDLRIRAGRPPPCACAASCSQLCSNAYTLSGPGAHEDRILITVSALGETHRESVDRGELRTNLRTRCHS